jgi:hypothetical protein
MKTDRNNQGETRSDILRLTDEEREAMGVPRPHDDRQFHARKAEAEQRSKTTTEPAPDEIVKKGY